MFGRFIILFDTLGKKKSGLVILSPLKKNSFANVYDVSLYLDGNIVRST